MSKKYKGLIVILEGPDGVGKSTLANAIADTTKGSVLHPYFDKSWDMYEYHRAMFACALMLCSFRPMVLDRWAVSEYVYAKVFRDGPSYDVPLMIDEAIEAAETNNLKMVWVYCTNDSVVENHNKNKSKRDEMFDDMEKVSTVYDEFVNTKDVGWVRYDFLKDGTKKNLSKFVKKLTEGVNL